jgi:hypothetical protein
MSIEIDGNSFTTYILDNEYTIKRRYAHQLKTIPKFVHLKKIGDNRYESTALKELINNSNVNSLEELKNKNDKYFQIPFVELMSLWCGIKYEYKVPGGDNPDYFPFDNFVIKNNYTLNQIEIELNNFKIYYINEIKSLNNTYVNELKILQNFDRINKIHSTNLNITKVKKEYIYTVAIDPYNFFDLINLSNDIPYASTKDFYKLYKGFKPLTKWIFLNDDINTLMSQNRSNIQNKNESNVIILKVSNVENTPILKEYEKNISDTDVEKIEKEMEESEKKIQNIKDDIYNDVYITFKSTWDEYIEEKQKKELLENREKQRLKSLKIKEKEEEKEEKELEKRVKRKGFISKNITEKNTENLSSRFNQIEDQEKKIKELEQRRFEIEQEEIKKKKKEYKIHISIESKEGSMDIEKLKNRVLSCFGVPVTILKEAVEKQIQSEFYIPNQLIDFPILKDMFFNNELFKRYLQLDERSSIYKFKNNMYFYFISDEKELKSNYIACSLMQKNVEKTDLKIIEKDPTGLLVGTNFLHIKIIRSNNLKESKKFKDIFCKYIQYYNDNKNKVIDDYKKIYPTQNKINELLKSERTLKETKIKAPAKGTTKKTLKSANPETFISGYARICQKKFQPKILEENEIQKYYGNDTSEEDIEKRKHIILYPKTEDEGTQYYYSCMNNTNDYKFPGLQRNTGNNFDQIPVVPCCFKKDQSEKLDSIYNLYYDKDMNFKQIKEHFVEKDKNDVAGHFITTQKFVSSGRFGDLPKDIISFFHSVDPGNNYYRKGTLGSEYSVIDLLLYASVNGYENLTIEQKQNNIENKKQEIIRLIQEKKIKFLQESYNVNVLQILNDNNYIDPHTFHQILQHIFKCNIIIFTRNQQNPDGVLSCPNFNKEYLQFTNDENSQRKYVLVYEHMGAESDNAKYPRCEIIFRQIDKNNKKIHPIFKHDDQFIKTINDCLIEMYPIRLFKPIKTFFKEYNVDFYGLNEYGKTVYLRLKRNEKTIHMITTPLPNMNLDIEQTIISFSKYNQYNNIEISFHFSRKENIDLISIVKNGIFYGFQFSIDSTNFYIPIEPRKSQENISDTNNINFPIIDNKNNQITINKLDIYNDYKSVSKLLLEYFYYLFSIDYNLYQPDFITNQYIHEFVQRNIRVTNAPVNYNNLLLNRTLFNIDIFQKSSNTYELPVPNNNVLNKLVYNLKLKLDRQYTKLINYSNLQYIESSYEDIEDFKISLENNNTVIKGIYPMLQWIKATKNIYDVYDYIQLPNISMYDEINNILDENQKNHLLLLVFISKWSRPSKNIQNKLFSNKTRKLIFDKYKNKMTIIYVDIDNHKNISEYFNISKLPTFIFAELNQETHLLDIIGRIEGSFKTFENIKLLNAEIKKILKDTIPDNLTTIINNTKNDDDFDKNIDEIIDEIVAEINADDFNEDEQDKNMDIENINEEKRDDYDS